MFYFLFCLCRKCALTGTSRFCLHRVKLSEKGDWHNLSRNSRVRVSSQAYLLLLAQYVVRFKAAGLNHCF